MIRLDQGNRWIAAEVEIKTPQVSLVCIQATKGYGITSDIAVDNVVLIGSCCRPPTTTTTTTSTTTTPPPPPTTMSTFAPPPISKLYHLSPLCSPHKYAFPRFSSVLLLLRFRSGWPVFRQQFLWLHPSKKWRQIWRFRLVPRQGSHKHSTNWTSTRKLQ